MMTEQIMFEMIEDEDLEAAVDDLHDALGRDRLAAGSREGRIAHVVELDRELPGLAKHVEAAALKNAEHRRKMVLMMEEFDRKAEMVTFIAASAGTCLLVQVGILVFTLMN